MLKKILLSLLVVSLALSGLEAVDRKPPVSKKKKAQADSTVVRLHLSPVLLEGSGEVILQDVWERGTGVELHGATSLLNVQPREGFGTPDAMLVLSDPLAEGETYSALVGRELTYGWKDPVDVLSGEGVVKDGVLEITLRRNSAYVRIEPGHAEVAIEPFNTAYERQKVAVPQGGLLVMLPPQSQELAVFLRDSTELRTAVLAAGEAGTCKTVGAPAAPWRAATSSLMASTLQTKNLSTGKDYTPGEYSGITPLPDGRYALVHNGAKGGGIYFANFSFELGRITSARIEAAPGTLDASDARDPEGITYVAATNTLWVSGEKDQKILEYDLNGRPTGRSLAIPSDFMPAELSTGNGFESLSYSAGTGLMWTVTEEPLKRDADWFPVGNDRRMLRLQAFNMNTLAPVRQRFYAMDAPRYKPTSGDTYVHGVAELLALDDGTLLVLEREVYVPRYDQADKASMLSMLTMAVTQVKLYLVDPTSSEEALLSKVLVGSFYTRFPGPISLLMGADPQLANFEGMCLGPQVDGHQTVLLVNDSERGKGNSYARLQDYVRVMLF